MQGYISLPVPVPLRARGIPTPWAVRFYPDTWKPISGACLSVPYMYVKVSYFHMATVRFFLQYQSGPRL